MRNNSRIETQYLKMVNMANLNQIQFHFDILH